VSVRVKSVTIGGFKSFGERVRVEFMGGVNAVIGPNGSGKSNVIEAIRWASHTARTRELRVRESTELIFHGSSGKAPVNVAEVLLELEGVPGAGLLNVARRLYRDGDTELEIHGRSVRVRDLHDVLRGSGLGPGGIAVVGQGEIGAVVGASPVTMLGYLEEAAGLSRATHRRAQSIDRLEAARVHLERAEDLALEVRGRVARLEAEARAAAEFEALSTELSALEAALNRQRVRTLQTEIARLDADIAAAERAVTEGSSAVTVVTAALEGLRETREARQSAFARLSAEAARLTGEINTLRERAEGADQSVRRAEEERAALEAERAGLGTLEPPVAPTAPEDDLNALNATLEAMRQALRAAEASDLEARKRLADARLQRDRAESAARAQRDEVTRRSTERAALEAQIAETNAELEAARAERLERAPTVDELKTELEALVKLQDRLEREAHAISARLLEAGSKLNEARGARGSLGKELARLERVRESRAYLSDGPRRALESGVSGIVGPVSDLLRVPQHLETAIGAALGRRVENIVVESGEVARAVIEGLKRNGGRATFLPLDLLRTRAPRKLPIATERGVLGFAAELVGISEVRLSGVLENLFGETLVVETLETALKLARQYRDRPRLVTLDGELLEAGGAVTGGRGRDNAGETFAEARRLEEARTEFDALEASIKALEASLEDDQTAASASREAVARTDTRAKELRGELEAARTAVVQVDARLEALEARAETLEARLRALQPLAGSVGGDAVTVSLEGFEAALADTAAQVASARDAERHADTAVRDAQARARVYAEQQRTHAQVLARIEQLRERRTAIDARLNALEAQRAEWLERLQLANPELQRLEQEAAALDLPAARAELDALEAERKTREAELAARTRDLSNQRETVERARDARSRREGSLEALLEELLPGSADRAGALETLLGTPDPDGTPRTWTSRVAQVRARITEIGAVNMLAAQDYARETERLDALERGVSDAKAAVAELQDALETLEREVTAKLKDSIERVSVSFRTYITELLGGDGELELVRDAAGALEGLAMRVTPKGKRTRSLHLLSAGERTMAALAYLFALSSAPEDHAGLPLAVMDEVDAPLDEANIRRFTHFLRVLAGQGTQFILVTHQKATMEIADALWGVTTDASGTSRTFSIKNEQAALSRA
jgi:chromosome segregation protein